MEKLLTVLFCLCAVCSISADVYNGRVVDESGAGIGYATVYLLQAPEIGTATNMDGSFSLETGVSAQSQVVVSFLGYEKQELRLADISTKEIVLKEQPIALEEMVIEGKKGKSQKNRRKQMSELLYKVYNQMGYDFPERNVGYKVVSDVRMDSESKPWGMEQMIGRAVVLQKGQNGGNDKVQFAGELCKRYFAQEIRDRANVIYEKGELDKEMLNAASEVDSGVVVHKSLWMAGNIRYDFESTMNDIKHWVVTRENEGETVLTHTEKHNYLGIVKYEVKRHYIVDSNTYRVLRFSEEGSGQVNIPFGYKLKGVYLELLNLLNMSEQQIDKFRLRKAVGKISLNTIYDYRDGGLVIVEKNLVADAVISGSKKQDIPLKVNATQRATNIEIGVEPLGEEDITNRVRRENVTIY